MKKSVKGKTKSQSKGKPDAAKPEDKSPKAEEKAQGMETTGQPASGSQTLFGEAGQAKKTTSKAPDTGVGGGKKAKNKVSKEALAAGVAKNKYPITLAKDMKSDELYVNIKGMHIGEPHKMVRLLEKRDNGKVHITFYAENLREWLTVDVYDNWELTTDLSLLGYRQQLEKEQGANMKKVMKKAAKSSAKKAVHTGEKVAKAAAERTARAVNEKTGCKEGSVGDLVGIAILACKTKDGIFKGVCDVVKGSFEKKGKSTKAELVESQARAWIGAHKKNFPKIYGEHLEAAYAKPEAKKAEKTEKAAA